MNESRFNRVLTSVDEANAKDPHNKELIYGQRMSSELNSFCPEASELLQIAVRAQHLERWVLARSDFPEGRSGYKKWRSQLALHHANRTAELMSAAGYQAEDLETVKYLLLKRGLKHNAQTQTLEDVACLVFLKYYFEEFAQKHSEDKLINILRLTWKKMSEQAHEAALKLSFKDGLGVLVEKALSED